QCGRLPVPNHPPRVRRASRAAASRRRPRGRPRCGPRRSCLAGAGRPQPPGSDGRNSRHRESGSAAAGGAVGGPVGDVASARQALVLRVDLHRLMGLAALTDAFATYLESALEPAPALVGATYPATGGELPAVVLSVTGVQQQLRGIGRLPAPSVTGALPVTNRIDLANPVATFPDAVVPLLSNDRLTLTLPHGPLVAADGTTTTFGTADLHVTVDATTFAVVDTAPGAGRGEPDPDLGVLHFGAPLPATGTLNVSYFIGEWEVRTERYQGTVLVEVFATDDAGADSLSRAVEIALLEPTGGGPTGLNEIQP